MLEEIEIIDRLLKDAGKSKADLAKCWGRKPSAASAFFNGKRELALGDLDKTARLLGITTTQLVGKLRGEDSTSSEEDAMFLLAIARGSEAVERQSAKLNKTDFTEYVYTLYKLALSEKRIVGMAVLTLPAAELVLKMKLETKAPH